MDARSPITDEQARRLLYWIWYADVCGAGSIGGNILLGKFGLDPEAVYNADLSDLRCEGVKQTLIDNLIHNKSLDEAKRILEYCRKDNVGIVTLEDDAYPFRLKQVLSRPILLYYKGRLPDFDTKLCVAVVGTRNVSKHGIDYTFRVSFDLARCGAVVVSGMAKGGDSYAHGGALEAGETTVAVLGCGIDRIYPAENERLMKNIIKNGAVITEYKPGTAPYGYNFPTRNRIISGLCQATLVTEASETSGALITAKYAEQQGRDIFAMPGNAGELRVSGSNKLLVSGKAMLAVSAYDILAKYVAQYPFEIDISKLSRYDSAKSSPLASDLKVASKNIFDNKAFYESYDKREREKKKKQTDINKKPNELTAEPVDAVENYELGDKVYVEKLMSDITDDIYSEDNTGFAEVNNAHEKVEKPVKDEAGDTQKKLDLGRTEKMIYDAMSDTESMSADDIIHKGFSVSDVFRSLTLLEISGAIEAVPGGLYIKKKI